jgi:hypothetical protein
MNVAESIHAELTGHAGTFALVGDRVHHGELPQEPTLPAISFLLSTGPTEHVMSSARAAFKRPVYRLQCWSEVSWLETQNVATQVELALDGFYGLLGGAGGVNRCVLLVNSVELDDPPTGWRRKILDFEVWG